MVKFREGAPLFPSRCALRERPLRRGDLAHAQLGANVDVKIVYSTNQFAKHMGTTAYQVLCGDMTHLYSGLGDWLFRSLAFPNEPDNTAEYLRRFYPGPSLKSFRNEILALRRAIPELLDALMERHALHEAELCGFTSMFQQTCGALALARMLKKRIPRQTIVMGGPNCDAPMGEVLLRIAPQLDAVFSGPSLKSFPAFVSQAMTGLGAQAPAITGVIRRRRLPVAEATASVGQERDINDEVIVNYEEFTRLLKSEVDPELKPLVSFETSRGCWWGERAHCTFCGLNAESMGYRSLAPSKAIKLFDRMFAEVPDAASYAAVDNILPKTYAREALPFVRPPKGTHIFYEDRRDRRPHDRAICCSPTPRACSSRHPACCITSSCAAPTIPTSSRSA